MYRSLSAVIAAVSLLAALPANAHDLNKRLKGSYAVSIVSFCAQSNTTFSPESQALNTVFPLHRNVESIRTYDGDGNVTLTGRTFQLASSVTAPGSFPTSESEFTCAGTYQVNDDLTFSETITCSGNIVVGSAAGRTFTQEPITTKGRIHGSELFFSGTRGMPQTIIHVEGAPSPSFRLCAGSGSGVKVKEEKEE